MKSNWLIAISAVLFGFSCGNHASNPVSNQDVNPDSSAKNVFEFTQNMNISYVTDTVEGNVVITFPDSAGYELNLSDQVKNGYDFYGEYDKNEEYTIEFIALASPKIQSLDEKDHLENELKAAARGQELIIHERGELHDILFSRYYAITSMFKNEVEYKGLVTLHFDPKLNNYYFVLIQTPDIESYKHDINLLYPFLRDLRFINKG